MLIRLNASTMADGSSMGGKEQSVKVKVMTDRQKSDFGALSVVRKA